MLPFFISGKMQRTGNFTGILGGGTKRVCRDARVAVRAAVGESTTSSLELVVEAFKSLGKVAEISR